MLSPETAFHQITQWPNVTCLVSPDFCELPYLYGIFSHLSAYPSFPELEFVITDHLHSVDHPHQSMVVIYLSNEDHRIPEYVEEVKQVFTPYPPENSHEKVEGIPLGPNGYVPLFPVSSIEERQQKLFFAGRKMNRRKAFFEGIQPLRANAPDSVEITSTKAFSAGFNPEVYGEKLANMAIVPAPEGNFSNITFRLFEGMRQGAVVLAPQLPDTWFLKEFPGFIVEDWHSLPSLVPELLADQKRLRNIQKATLSFYKDYCSEKAVADYMAWCMKLEAEK